MKANPSNSPKKTFFANFIDEAKQKSLKSMKRKLQNYDFSQKRTQDQKIDDCLQVMQLDRDRRFKTEQMIIENATKNFPFFTKLIRKGYQRQVVEIYKVITPLSLKKGDCVFYQGDIADNFYILLRGKVTVITHKDQGTIEKERQLLTYDEATEIQNYIQHLQAEKDEMRAEISSLKNNQNNQFSLSPTNLKERQLKIDVNKVRRNSLSSIGESNTPLSQSFSEYSPKKQSNKVNKISRQQTKSKFQSKQGSIILNENESQDVSPQKSNGDNYSRFSFKFLFEKAQEILNEQTQKSSARQITEEINLFGINRNNSTQNQDDSLSPSSYASADSPVKTGRKTSYFLFNEDINLKNLNKNQQLVVPELPANLRIQDIAHPSKLFQNGIYVYSNANTIKEGDSFGEGGLILKRPRTATVICNTDCDFAVISRSDYDLILKEIQNKKINKKIQMLVENMDKNIPFQTASRFCFAFFKIQLSFNQPAFQQGEHPSYVYYLKKGEIEIIKNEKVQSQNIENGDLSAQEQVNQMKMFGNTKSKNRTISSISDGQFFGEEDVLDNKNERSYTARVRSSFATIYRIKAGEFRLILSQSGSVKDFFTTRMMQRQEWRANQKKKVDSTVYQLEQPLRNQTKNVNEEDTNQIVSGVDDIDKIIEFCQEKQIISPRKLYDVENFSQLVDMQSKKDSSNINKTGQDSTSNRNINSSTKIQDGQLNISQKRNEYLSSKRPQSASELYTTQNFIMTANKNNRQYVKEKGSELYSNENPIEQNLFYDDYKKKAQQRLQSFQSIKNQNRLKSASPSQKQKTHSSSVLSNFKQEESPSVKKSSNKIDERKSFQEYHSKQYPSQTPKAVQSLVSIKEFNLDCNIQEDEEETENIKTVKEYPNTMRLTKNRSAPLIYPGQIISNQNILSDYQLDKEGSILLPNGSPTQRLMEEQNDKLSKFQINLLQSLNQNSGIQSYRKSDTIANLESNSPRILVKEKFSGNMHNRINQNQQKINFQKKVKLQEQLRKSNRKQRSINLKKLINIQDALFNISGSNKNQVNHLQSSIAFYFPNYSTMSQTQIANLNQNTNSQVQVGDVKPNFDSNSIPNKSGNYMTYLNSSRGKIQQNQDTFKSKMESQISYQIPNNFQNVNEKVKLKTSNFPGNRIKKYSSLHSQQATNDNSYGFSPNSKSNSNYYHLLQNQQLTIQSTNFLVEEKRQLASAQIEFINRFKQFQTEQSKQRVKSAIIQIENKTPNPQMQEFSQTEQISSINAQQNTFSATQLSSQSQNKQKKLLFRPKSAILKASTISFNQNEVNSMHKETSKIKGQKHQAVINQINLFPEYLGDQQQTFEHISSLYNQNTEKNQKLESEKDKQLSNKKQLLLYQKFKQNQAFENEQNLNKEFKMASSIFQRSSIHLNDNEENQFKQNLQLSSTNNLFRDFKQHDLKSPSIINLVFPQGNDKKNKKNSQHKKQNSLNMQNYSRIYKIDEQQQKKFDVSSFINQKQQKIRPQSSIDTNIFKQNQLSSRALYNNSTLIQKTQKIN